MLLDSLNTMSQAQAVTVTALSTDVIDLGVARDLGPGFDINAFAQVTTAFTAAGAATLEVQLLAADTADMLTNPIVLMSTGAIPKADLTVGAQFFRTGVGVNRKYAGQRYLAFNYIVSTGPMTAGAITAGLALDVQNNPVYPEGNNVTYV